MSIDRTSPARTLSRVLPITRYAVGLMKIDATRVRSSAGEGKKVGRKNTDTVFHKRRSPINERRPGNRSGRGSFTGPLSLTQD
jgi:hypothetical protein